MKRSEEVARDYHKQGHNCSNSVYEPFKSNLKIEVPKPRSVEGMCGALICGIKILDTLNIKHNLKEEFEYEFGYTKCFDLMRNDKRCNDYVGYVAKRVEELKNK